MKTKILSFKFLGQSTGVSFHKEKTIEEIVCERIRRKLRHLEFTKRVFNTMNPLDYAIYSQAFEDYLTSNGANFNPYLTWARRIWISNQQNKH